MKLVVGCRGLGAWWSRRTRRRHIPAATGGGQGQGGLHRRRLTSLAAAAASSSPSPLSSSACVRAGWWSVRVVWRGGGVDGGYVRSAACGLLRAMARTRRHGTKSASLDPTFTPTPRPHTGHAPRPLLARARAGPGTGAGGARRRPKDRASSPPPRPPPIHLFPSCRVSTWHSNPPTHPPYPPTHRPHGPLPGLVLRLARRMDGGGKGRDRRGGHATTTPPTKLHYTRGRGRGTRRRRRSRVPPPRLSSFSQ